MARIPLDGFLLSPVQKICRYPVQLKELLEHTPPGHPDHWQLERAVDAMKVTVQFINERKRKMESLEMLTMLQNSINDWQVTDDNFGNFRDEASVIIGGMQSLVGFSVIPKCIARFSMR